MGTTLWGQAGTLSFSAQSAAANGLRRLAVVWNGYGPNQQVITLQVRVSVSVTDLLYLDADAMAGQTLGLPNATLSPVAPISGGSSISFTATNFNTSAYAGPRTLFVINYAATPDCASPVDTTLLFSFPQNAGTNLYQTSSGLSYMSANVTLAQSFGCGYISGSINSPFGDPFCSNTNVNGGIPGVDVNAYFQTLAAPPANVITGSNYDKTGNNGAYLIESLPSGLYLKVRPARSDKENCGVTSDDVRLMRGYILGIPSVVGMFQYPWQLIAGDANLNGMMTTADIVVVNNIISGAIDGPWTFVPTTTYFGFLPPNGNNIGYPYMEEIPFSPFTANQQNQNYYGIKLADIDGSCTECPPGLQGTPSVETRASSGIIAVPLADRTLWAGEELALPLRLEAPEPMDILAWEIRFDPGKFDFQGITLGSLPFLTETSFVVPTDQPGIIRFVWTNLERDPIAAKYWQNIASVRLRAKTTLPSLQGFIAVTALNDNPSFGASPTQYRPVVKWSTDKFTTGICTVSPVPFDQSFQLSFHADQEGSA